MILISAKEAIQEADSHKIINAHEAERDSKKLSQEEVNSLSVKIVHELMKNKDFLAEFDAQKTEYFNKKIRKCIKRGQHSVVLNLGLDCHYYSVWYNHCGIIFYHDAKLIDKYLKPILLSNNIPSRRQFWRKSIFAKYCTIAPSIFVKRLDSRLMEHWVIILEKNGFSCEFVRNDTRVRVSWAKENRTNDTNERK